VTLPNTDLPRHLRDDAQKADELAVQHADSAKTKVWEHRRVTERCEAALFSAIARIHGVPPDQVREALGRQNDQER
jgi:hypothetical protein